MQLLTPIAPRVIPGRAIDILNVAPSRGMSRGFARVDLSDPVFFDHPLDHVPGMLLTAAILELAEHDSMLESDNVTFRLTFTRFCELDAPVQVTAHPGGQRNQPDPSHPVWTQYRDRFTRATRNPAAHGAFRGARA